MGVLHRLADWDCNHHYTPWLQRLHARLHDRDDKRHPTGRHT